MFITMSCRKCIIYSCCFADESDVKLVGGDIILTGAQQLELEFAFNKQDDDIFGPQNAVINRADYNWPNGVVYYRLDSSLGSEYYRNYFSYI